MEGGEDGTEGRDKKRGREGGRGGAVEKERKVENALFFSLSLVHMRAQLCVFAFSLPNLFYPMEIRHPSECVYVCMSCILFERVALVCIWV